MAICAIGTQGPRGASRLDVDPIAFHQTPAPKDFMPLLVLPFPAIDPVLISIGPFAIRWYALAYIAGILLGWFYARRLIANAQLWGGEPPMTVADYDDFVLWVTLGIILGGRAGYVLFYNFPFFAAHPLEILQLWKGGMSFHGGFLGCVLAVALFSWNRGISVPIARRRHLRGRTDRLVSRAARQFHQWRIVGPRGRRALGRSCFPNAGPFPRHPSQLYEAALEGLVLLVILTLMVRAGALKRSGLIVGAFACLYALMRFFCEFFREPDPQLGFLWGGLTMGMLLSIPLFLAGLVFIAIALSRPPLRKA